MSTISDIDALIERYYDADLSEQEEQTLMALLFGPYADDHRYDEHRAVMSFTTMGKRQSRQQKTANNSRTFSLVSYKYALGTVASVAACIVLALNVGLFPKANQDDYIMVRHGDKYFTSAEMAESEMKIAMVNVLESCPSVEDELANIFADFNN